MIPGISFQNDAGAFSRPILEILDHHNQTRRRQWLRSLKYPLLKSTPPDHLPFPESPIPQFPSTSIL